MRLYELIQRLEAIRDRMESTFTNEFLKGETDNLIDELKLLSPEIGKVIDTKSDEELLKRLKDNYPLPVQPPIIYPYPGTTPWVVPGTGTGISPIVWTTTTSGDITITADASPIQWQVHNSGTVTCN